ncbi:MAG: sulfite exporter TauE/SafE family protein, partial [Nostocoides sp.]
VGSAIGALLLLWLPASAFKGIVPVLIGLGLVLVILGPSIQRWSASRHHDGGRMPAWQPALLMAGVLLAGMYGGYFGAAQGVILMGLLSTLAQGSLQTLNGYKNVLALIANVVAGAVFVLVARDQIHWLVALFVGLGSLLGGVLGAGVGRRLPPAVLRAVIVVIGVAGIVKVVWFS